MSEDPHSEVAEADEDKASGKGARMSDADFAEARELYELGKATLTELTDTYGISRQAMSKRFKDAGVVRNSRVHEVAEAAAAAAKAATAASVSASIERFADKQSDWIEETRVTGYNSLKQATMIARKIVMDAIKAGRSISTVEDDLKSVERFSKILVTNIGASLKLLRADEHVNEDDLPSLTIEDLTDEEILQHHKNTGAFPDDMTIEEMLAEENELGGGDD